MKLTFVSNYLNHHQIPVSNRLYEKLGENYHFIQTEPMEEERINMGWDNQLSEIPYLLEYYKQPEICQGLIEESDMVLFGGVEDVFYIEKRLADKKPLIQVSERLYKEGQWKAVSPRGLIKKYKDHIRYRKQDVFLLCAGGYVASDFHLIKAYPRKMFEWGYFPAFIPYTFEQQNALKTQNKIVKILWAGRMISWKHPEIAIETANFLQKKGYAFSMAIIGDGPMKEDLINLAEKYEVSHSIDFLGFIKPEQVREYMEEADIFLFTSDYKEGWGAVLNEAMNSCCAVIANTAIGAVPSLIEDGKNGLIYKNGKKEELFLLTEYLINNKIICEDLGFEAYKTIANRWNPEKSADKLLELCYNLLNGEENYQLDGPCSLAKIISPRKMYRHLKKRNYL